MAPESDDDVKLKLSVDDTGSAVLRNFEALFSATTESVQKKAATFSESVSKSFSASSGGGIFSMLSGAASGGIGSLLFKGLDLFGSRLQRSGKFDDVFSSLGNGMASLSETADSVLLPSLSAVGDAITKTFFEIFPSAANQAVDGGNLINDVFRTVAIGGVGAMTALEVAITNWQDTWGAATASAGISLLKLKDISVLVFKELALGFANTANMFTPLLDGIEKAGIWTMWTTGQISTEGRDSGLKRVDQAAAFRNSFLGMLNLSNQQGAPALSMGEDPAIKGLQDDLQKRTGKLVANFLSMWPSRLAKINDIFGTNRSGGSFDNFSPNGGSGGGGFGGGAGRGSGAIPLIESSSLTWNPFADQGPQAKAQQTRTQSLDELRAIRRDQNAAQKETLRVLNSLKSSGSFRTKGY